MDFKVEKYISNFIENQFPAFYNEDGENFILFLKAYYEWMESTGQPVKEARELLNYRDIDNTLESFLEHFQKKYLYGIPFSVIANKRFLLKHILDVYRSKGSIQGFKLLFKLLYNEDVEVYLPGRDILRVDDGTWKEPKFLEISESVLSSNLVGKTIQGLTSGATAVVENYIREAHNENVLRYFYITNITPKGGAFALGETLVEFDADRTDVDLVMNSPFIQGSLDYMDIIDGGQGFEFGDLIKIVTRDRQTGNVVAFGHDGILRVTELGTGEGAVQFQISYGGTGYLANSESMIYKTTANGEGADFSVGSLTSLTPITYNTDIVGDYLSLTIDALTYNFPADSSANIEATIADSLTYTTASFGTIFTLTEVTSGNSYDAAVDVQVRSTMLSKELDGTITFDTSSNTITGTGTNFTRYFAANDVFAFTHNGNGAFMEYNIITEVTNSTSLIIQGPPLSNSEANTLFYAAPTIIPSNFAFYEDEMFTEDGSVPGENADIIGLPSVGNNIVLSASAINSGKGFKEGEVVSAYLYSPVNTEVLIFSGGNNYSINDKLIFVGGDPAVAANAYVSNVNGNGAITEITFRTRGSGYKDIPTLRIQTSNGAGASLIADLDEFDLTSEIIGSVRKSGVGRSIGYFSTTRGFLDADKFLQDDYYYQDYSYELRVAKQLHKYRDIIYGTFHPAGSEMFGEYLKINSQTAGMQDAFSSVQIYEDVWSADIDTITADSTDLLASASRPRIYLLASQSYPKADSNLQTVDKYYI